MCGKSNRTSPEKRTFRNMTDRNTASLNHCTEQRRWAVTMRPLICFFILIFPVPCLPHYKKSNPTSQNPEQRSNFCRPAKRIVQPDPDADTQDQRSQHLITSCTRTGSNSKYFLIIRNPLCGGNLSRPEQLHPGEASLAGFQGML